MDRNNSAPEQDVSDSKLPNVLTVVGQGTPASFELTVDGQIESATATAEDIPTVSGSTVEGTVDTETKRFRFSGDVTAVTILNHGGFDSPSVVDPEIYVE